MRSRFSRPAVSAQRLLPKPVIGLADFQINVVKDLKEKLNFKKTQFFVRKTKILLFELLPDTTLRVRNDHQRNFGTADRTDEIIRSQRRPVDQNETKKSLGLSCSSNRGHIPEIFLVKYLKILVISKKSCRIYGKYFLAGQNNLNVVTHVGIRCLQLSIPCTDFQNLNLKLRLFISSASATKLELKNKSKPMSGSSTYN